jgi:hypothetical protein
MAEPFRLIPEGEVEYRFTYMPRYLEAQESSSTFTAKDENQAVSICAFLTECRMRAVIPNGEGTCKVWPRKLIEVRSGRVVHDFAAEGTSGWDFTCVICQVTMTAGPEGWTCPNCGRRTPA